MQVKVIATGETIEVIPKAIDSTYKFVNVLDQSQAYEFDELEPVRIRAGSMSQNVNNVGVRVGVTVTGNMK